jgi:hypothetical protein
MVCQEKKFNKMIIKGYGSAARLTVVKLPLTIKLFYLIELNCFT